MTAQRLTSEELLAEVPVALVSDDAVPPVLQPLIRRSLGGPLPALLASAAGSWRADRRQSAVLMLLAHGVDGLDLLLTQRAGTLRTHAGQPAFPGGAIDVGEDAVAAALREGQEETGLDPSSVTPLVLMPRLYLPRSEFVVQPVLAYWDRPGPVAPVNLAETAIVARVPIDVLADPANRVRVRFGDYVGVGFRAADMTIWGFTGALVDALLDLGGWTHPWEFDHTPTVDLARP